MVKDIFKIGAEGITCEGAGDEAGMWYASGPKGCSHNVPQWMLHRYDRQNYNFTQQIVVYSF